MEYLLFLDYDGTLTPIVKKPRLAKLSKKQKSALKKLAKAPNVIMAIVSGRKLSDLKRKVGISGIYYAGNHGFEISGPKTHLLHPKALAAKPVLRKIKKELAAKLKGIKGAWVEDKQLTLSLHFRQVKEKDFIKLKSIFDQVVTPYLKRGKVRTTSGKKVFEIRPNVDWNKGKAVLWFMQKLAKTKYVVPIYIGDDTTDEDAFAALKNLGITIRVGKTPKTHAQKFVANVAEVYKFLEQL
ncbi:MAG: trehalose-phosphatase [Candidatus Saganbacteria bacterium]|nr:trehalose-phosphatase [Candidatus Saganbacteria bacterium]